MSVFVSRGGMVVGTGAGWVSEPALGWGGERPPHQVLNNPPREGSQVCGQWCGEWSLSLPPLQVCVPREPAFASWGPRRTLSLFLMSQFHSFFIIYKLYKNCEIFHACRKFQKINARAYHTTFSNTMIYPGCFRMFFFY